MTKTTIKIADSASHLRTLRALMPARPLTLLEAITRAELQANRLLELVGITDGPVPESVITDQPRLVVEHAFGLTDSGVSTWDHGAWRVQINGLEPHVRQRFTLAHEYKHVLDAPVEQQVYALLRNGEEPHLQIEKVCDHFAACLLMPKKLVKRVWGEGLRDAVSLAAHFDVSPQAMHIRLQTLGLIERPARCRTSTGLIQQRRIMTQVVRPRTYWRASSPSFAGATP